MTIGEWWPARVLALPSTPRDIAVREALGVRNRASRQRTRGYSRPRVQRLILMLMMIPLVLLLALVVVISSPSVLTISLV